MPLLPAQTIPEPGTYVRYYDVTLKDFRYLRLMERDYPLLYPRRLSSVAPGSVSSRITMRDINPSKDKHHVYQAFLGLYPGALYRVYHPYDYQAYQLDEAVLQIDSNFTSVLSYKESPYDGPTRAIWIQYNRYPAVEARNISPYTMTPQVDFAVIKFLFKPHDDLGDKVVADLDAGHIPFLPISFGGEW